MHWLHRHRLTILAAICVSWTMLNLLGHFFPAVPFLSIPWRAEQSFEDLLRGEGRTTATRDDFAFLGIDQSTLELPPLSAEEVSNNRALQLMTARPFPWSREVWAILLDKLFAAGARLVVFDLVFNPPNDGDPVFRDALNRYHDRVVIGENFDMRNAAQLVLPNATLIPPPAAEDVRVGFVNYFTDPIDRKLRSARFFTSDRQLAGLPPHPSATLYASLATRALLQLGRTRDVIYDQRDHLFRFSSEEAYQPLPLYEVFDPKLWHANYRDGALFKNKIVIVGASAQILHDFVDTPMGANTLGAVVHLHVMAAAMAHEFLRPTHQRVMIGLVLGAGTLAWGLISFLRRPLLCLLLLLALSGIYLALARISYDRIGLLLLTVPVLGAFLFSGVFSLGFEYALERIEKVRTRRTLERYVSKNIVSEILDSPDSFYSRLRGARLPVTVLFSDLIGFTSMSEHAEPEALVTQLNEYLTRMVAAVFQFEGTLDKFVGDAVMAVWGNVRSRGVVEDARLCARAALAMRHALFELNRRWQGERRIPFGMGIGINQGEVLIGNIGSQERMDPTVIGDAVNLASRLESLTRVYGYDILIGAAAADLIRDEFFMRSVARVQVKGKSEPVEVSALLAVRGAPFDQEFLRWLDSYEDGLRQFRARKFTDAKISFSRFLEFYPDDFLAKMYLERALEYEKQPPDEEWNATEIFKTK